MRKMLLLLGFLLTPSITFGAGFGQGSIFLSKSPVTEGESVLIHVVVQNSSASDTFAGTLAIKDEGAAVGSVPVSLKAGAAETVSVLWKPAAGSHKIAAELQGKDGKVVENESETFVIKEKPPTTPEAPKGTESQTASAIESSEGIQNGINGVSPAVGSAVAPVFKLLDGGREAIADALDSQLANTKPKVTQVPLPGLVAGTSTAITTPDQGSWLWSIFYTIYFYILTVVRFVIGSAAIFYPVVAILFLLVMWRMFRRFRRA